MHLKYRNVNEAFCDLVSKIHTETIPVERTSSRVGEILTINEPVIITYRNPTERVLFNTARACNPFFHIYESLWMLAGRDDLAPLEYYVPSFKNYSDDGKGLWGAYGYRWRHHFDIDQINTVIKELKKDPKSRRCVIGMWDPEIDLEKAVSGGKDVPCNISICFRIETGNVLTMTVFNRSNDMVWGMLGANVVHMSFLHEYVCQSLGCMMGDYNQISNNLHVYTENWRPEEWLGVEYVDWYSRKDKDIIQIPLLTADNQGEFDRENTVFTSMYASKDSALGARHTSWDNEFLGTVAKPALTAYAHYKEGPKDVRNIENAIRQIVNIRSDDWRVACHEWMYSRFLKLTEGK